MDIKLKKFVVVPRDALDVLMNRHSSLADATETASQGCAETGITCYVLEMKAVAARADRPVKVRKL